MENETKDLTLQDAEQSIADAQLIEPKPMPQVASMWNNTKLFNMSFKLAGYLSQSDLIPDTYRGKQGNCLIAIDIANRMGVSPLMIMQNSQIVRGKFSWTGSACKAMIDGCGRYKNTHYVEVGERGTDSWGYFLEALSKNGDIVQGVTVTVKTAKDEKWWDTNAKWRNMTELMLKYRCAAFFMRTECASLAMGFLTSEEVEDTIPENKKTNANLITAMIDEEEKK